MSDNRQDETRSCVATTMPGMESVLEQELIDLGATGIESMRSAVRFRADKSMLYRANLELRTALRVLVPVGAFAAAGTDELHKGTCTIPWQRYLTPQMTFAIRAPVTTPSGDDPRFAALKVKDAIVDTLRAKYGRRPNVDVKNPDLQINLFWDREGAIISLDSSGESLHRRGYRSEHTAAPLSEVLAAGMVLLSGWDRQSTFYNPMCGSGTIGIEAALIGGAIAPGLLRQRFGFQGWRDYDEGLWKSIHAAAAEAAGNSSRAPVVAGDIDPAAVRIAVRNLERTGFADLLRVVRRDVVEQEPPKPVGEHPVVVINPPYGIRLHEPEIEQLYARIGDRLKSAYRGWDAWIISGNAAALKRVGLRSSRRIALYNGPIECRYNQYTLY